MPRPNTSRRLLESTAEQRQVLAADERRREFHQEKRQEFESYVEEVDDGESGARPSARRSPLAHCARSPPVEPPEQNERSRESVEQWREFHHDGMHPPYEYNRRTD